MLRRTWVGCGFLAVALAISGCVVPCHKGYQKSLEHGADCPLPTTCRNRVHVFMIHGLTPSTDRGLNALRLKLGENGFPMVGTGEMCHWWWVKNEIECIRQNDSAARFVLIGYDYGAAVATGLARDLRAKNINVDAVVLLDPKGCGPDPCGVNTLMIVNGRSTACAPHSARVVVPDATHFGLPAHPTTVAVVTDLLSGIAFQTYEPEVEEIPVWSYPHAPEAVHLSPNKTGAEWDFLADRTGPTRAIGVQMAAQPVNRPAAAAAVPAVPVAVKR
ncbi:MAG TPA: hypothetical protein VGE74_18770 [Gemmata sp.]